MGDIKRVVRKKPYKIQEPLVLEGGIVGWRDVSEETYANTGVCRKVIRDSFPAGTYKIIAECGTIVKSVETVERTTIKEA